MTGFVYLDNVSDLYSDLNLEGKITFSAFENGIAGLNQISTKKIQIFLRL